jgi:NAD-dependent deacetylase
MSAAPPAIVVGPSDRVFILTGAGISAESGIRTFRDAGGLWETHRFEDVASPEAFARDPQLVWRFYSQRRQQMVGCQPNAAHRALGELGRQLGDRLFLCTQNVDDLHERGGSTQLLHMHGELGKTRCEGCARPAFTDESLHEGEVPVCSCGGRLRPDIVWFGEVPMGMSQIARALEEATIFVTIGSSGAVYPAAGFVHAVRHHARAIYVGPERPDNDWGFDEVRTGTAVEVVPSLFRVADRAAS